jgi:hypothetical protein
MEWRLLSRAFLDAGLTPRPDADVISSETDQGSKEPSDPQLALIEGSSDVLSSADDDIW